ncbi:MAG: hypothetical protein OEZ34_00530 [Spirochaetia bacterium]|nr:hypothetical protein [Spirochaetia bacterium]
MEFDKTRKAIKTDKLTDTDRREMLDKFHSAGGEVLREKSVSNPLSESSESGKRKNQGSSGAGGGETRLPSEIAREKNRKEQEIAAKLRQEREKQEREASGFIAQLMIRLKCKLQGVATFSGEYVIPRFMSTLNLDLKRSVMEFHILANELFSTNKKVCDAVIKELDEKNPLYVELLERASYLYDRDLLTDLTRSYMENHEIPVRVDSIRFPLFGILKKIYYLKPYQETYLKAVDLAISIEEKMTPKPPPFYPAKRKKVKKDWNSLMDEIFPSLVLLAQCAELMKAEPYTELFENMIGVKLSEKPGSRKAGELPGKSVKEEAPAESEASEDTEETDTEEETVSASSSDTFEDISEDEAQTDELKYGNALLSLRNLEKIRSEIDPRNDWGYVKKYDKMLIAHLLFHIFEKDFSFVLTTNKIQMNLFQRGDSKIDIRRKMSNILDNSHVCQDAFRKYLLEAQEYHRTETEVNTSSNYVEHAKRLSNIDGRRGASGREFKKLVGNFMLQVKEVLEILIEDIKGPLQIVINPDENMMFELPADRKRRLHGKPVKQCIWEAYIFAMAVSELIERGVLYGGVIEVEPEDYAGLFERPPEEPDKMDMPF